MFCGGDRTLRKLKNGGKQSGHSVFGVIQVQSNQLDDFFFCGGATKSNSAEPPPRFPAVKNFDAFDFDSKTAPIARFAVYPYAKSVSKFTS